MKLMKISAITLFFAGILCLIFMVPVTNLLTVPSRFGLWIGFVDLVLYLLPFGVLLFFLYRVNGSDFRFILMVFSFILRIVAAITASYAYSILKMNNTVPDDVICVMAAGFSSIMDAVLIWTLVRSVNKGSLAY